MNKNDAIKKLTLINQEHLLFDFEDLADDQKENLLNQIEQLDISVFQMQQAALFSRHLQNPSHSVEKNNLKKTVEPLTEFDRVKDYKGKSLIGLLDVLDESSNGTFQSVESIQLIESIESLGKDSIANGEVGVVLIAGGQGTRLGIKGPKGIFPVSVIKKKSLFQIFSEKVVAAGKRAGRKLPVAIMTSPQNHNQTVAFFLEHNNFGINPHFFIQGELPFLDDEGRLFCDRPGHIAEGPNGNGSVFFHFLSSGIYDDWFGQGVRYVSTVLIDNPLADPFDSFLIGYHKKFGVDVVVKCTERIDPNEKVGVLVKSGGKVEVVEYSELSSFERSGNFEDYRCANLSLFSFNLDFIRRIATSQLPLHLAYKSVPGLDENKKNWKNGWKFEKFIFDVLPIASSVKVLMYPREICFAPLKNESGPDSLITVQEALQQRDRQVFEGVTGKKSPEGPFELSQEFYYPTAEFVNNWARGVFLDLSKSSEIE